MGAMCWKGDCRLIAARVTNTIASYELNEVAEPLRVGPGAAYNGHRYHPLSPLD